MCEGGGGVGGSEINNHIHIMVLLSCIQVYMATMNAYMCI